MFRRSLCLFSLVFLSTLTACSQDHKDKKANHTPQTEEEEFVSVYEQENYESSKDIEGQDTQEKEYNLPISDEESKQIEEECLTYLADYEELFQVCEEKNPEDVVVDEQTQIAIMDRLAAHGNPVVATYLQVNMRNDAVMEEFIQTVEAGKESKVTVYEVNMDGSIGRLEFCYTGEKMIFTYAHGLWEDGQSHVSTMSRARVLSWDYTKKGWFFYELCVPEPPVVAEEVGGTAVLRVKPMNSEYQKICDAYIAPIGYQGTNLFLTDWSEGHYGEMDFNDAFEYLYKMQYQKAVVPEDFDEGVPEELFEEVLTNYLPITKKECKKLAVYDKQQKIYPWWPLGCGNYAPDMYGTPIPEVVSIENKDNGILIVTVEAVWEEYATDCAFRHEVTLREEEDGTVTFLGNTITDISETSLPQYTHRLE
ncbi:DUF6070 family protein [Anaerosporobacter faecicola]|uniref:DUF6070 family protein n=1 Tax=Anaerosporobacter faecicola TaxID=2718714 RepID=UPI00143A27B7|nr:DUF6070 family protein [Anaerosporobacter faecicola]